MDSLIDPGSSSMVHGSNMNTKEIQITKYTIIWKFHGLKYLKNKQTNSFVLFIFLIPGLWLWGKHRLHHFRQCMLHIQKHSLWPFQIHFRTWKFQIHFTKKRERCWWFDLPKPVIIWALTGQPWGSLGERQGNFVIHALLPLPVSLHIWKGARAYFLPQLRIQTPEDSLHPVLVSFPLLW